MGTHTAAHRFAPFFMTGRLADALLRVDKNDAEDTDPFHIPVHRIILASSSPVFDALFESQPLSYEEHWSGRCQSSSSAPVGVWPLKVPNELSLRLVLEWCYFSTLSEGSLTPLNFWAVRDVANRLTIEGLVRYVDKWAAEELANGHLSHALTENDWANIIVECVRTGIEDQLLETLVVAAVTMSVDDSKKAATSKSAWEVAKYRYLRSIVTRKDVTLTAEEIKRLFTSTVTFTKFGISELVEAHADPALPREIIAEALMQTLIQKSQLNAPSSVAPESGKPMPNEIVLINDTCSGKDEDVPLMDAISPAVEPSVGPMQSTLQFIKDVKPLKEDLRHPETISDETPISAVLARLRQSSLDHIPRSLLLPASQESPNRSTQSESTRTSPARNQSCNEAEDDEEDLGEDTITLANVPDLTSQVPISPILDEGPSFSDEAPLIALQELRKQVQTLMARKNLHALPSSDMPAGRPRIPQIDHFERPSTPTVLAEVRRRLEDVVEQKDAEDVGDAHHQPIENAQQTTSDQYTRQTFPAAFAKKSARPHIKQISFAEVPTFITPSPLPGRSPPFSPATPGQLLGIQESPPEPIQHNEYIPVESSMTSGSKIISKSDFTFLDVPLSTGKKQSSTFTNGNTSFRMLGLRKKRRGIIEFFKNS
ncbi:uncharacterized protein SPPG_01854 [Spizellomyces punctatus DAOM BR117]|uniref:BTB domain-containing protein n=1 Tax=Spizellomyces punctatus (strain DAOM BR117) TaxID=645134 RepID=A0A0L0HNZ1_SPIPD|nr:uncharacterized protein SPPG_01854 [Spizellomyces punctatus DAOM BR117]KND02773.1 hypothetical protein SPPG_01854 [Spizellomyces punctatus DAOM BR117]|eukprot:XP_016610812.1 hypothetical protein SPPG_01854 [Spizellomyces punctatus DAOM BR117]